MDLVGAKEVLEIIKQLDGDSKESILRALNLAEHVEKTAGDFYQKEVEKTKGTELEAFFIFMVKEEEMHLTKIKELKANLENNQTKMEIQFDKNIYESTVNNINKLLKSIKDENDIVFLFGHNPTLNMLVEDYIDFYDNIPTCGIVKIEFNCNSWKDINPSNANFISFDYPKRYKK